MSDHRTALVALEAWSFYAPDVRLGGRFVDLGSLAEAMLYYDEVLVNVSTPTQLAVVIDWFVRHDAFDALLSLLESGTLRFVDFAFITTAALKDGQYSLLNIQDTTQARPGTFDQRYLYHRSIEEVLPKSRHRKRLFEACGPRTIEFKADDFGRGVENAVADMKNPARAALIVQTLVDEAYRLSGQKDVPTVTATVLADGPLKDQITWNVDFSRISELLGPNVGFHIAQPLTAIALANRLLWAAALLKSDLYAVRPMGRIISDKLHESAQSLAATREIITELQVVVDFPDIRRLVNTGRLTPHELLALRKRSKKFRNWLQNESDRDRDAIFAYHHEVARESGMTVALRRVMALVGVVGSGALGGAFGTMVGGPLAGALVGGSTAGAGYLLDMASRIGTDWRPIVFGDWLHDQTKNL